MDSKLAKEAREALVRRCFPGLNDLLDAAQSKCNCLSCTLDADSSATKQLKSGCLKFYAYSTVLSLLAHSIADAFGADDISGSQETALQANSPSPDIYHVESILIDVAQHSRVVWQTWFEVTAHVFLGHRYANVGASAHGNGFIRADDSMTIAIQHGELAVVAPLIDLSMKITHQGSFGFLPVRGRLCIPITAKPTSRSDYQMLSTDFAVIKTEETDSAEAISEEPQEWPCQALVETKSQDIRVDSIMYSADEGHYTLMTRVRAGEFSRLVDPYVTATMQAKHFNKLYAQPCPHRQGEPPENNGAAARDIGTFSFSKLLGRWPCPPLDRVHMSDTLETYLEYNIALGFAYMGIVLVNGEDCCRDCAAGQLFPPACKVRIRSTSGRFLINVAEHMRQGYVGGRGGNRICP